MRHAYLLKRLIQEIPKTPNPRALSKRLPDELSYVPKTAWLATATTISAALVLLTFAPNLQAKPTIVVYAGNQSQAIPVDSSKQITVKEALAKADIKYTEEDLVTPALDDEIDLSTTQIRIYQKRLATTADNDSSGVPSAQLSFVAPNVKDETEIEPETVILEYTVQENDTIELVAENHDISPETIRWANTIKDDKLEEGTTLRLLPVSGFEYEVKTGDSALSLAEAYASTAEEIITINNAEIDGLEIGSTIIIPDGIKPKPPKPPAKPKKPTALTPAVASSTPAIGGNTYAWGNCTWYASNRRAQIGRPIPNRWGNANAWGYSAAAQGYKVNHTPALGAIMVQAGAVHVTIVEKLNPDGSILVSEMNWNWRLGVKSTRTIPTSSVSSHSYIH